MFTERGGLPRGFSLIEMVIAIVVLGVGIAGLTGLFAGVTRQSADPMLRKQALSVAEGLLKEIQLQCLDASGGCTPPVTRGGFTQVRDYDGYATAGIVTLDGNAVAGLEAFSVRVTVVDATLSAGGLSVTPPNAVLITVEVSWPQGTVALSGYRTAFAPDA